VSDLIYLYGFVPEPLGGPTRTLAGIGDRPVELVEINGIQAVISQVDTNEYDSQRIESRMQDLGWVAEQGVAHERVVAWFVDRTQILPASLFTLYSSLPALRRSTEAQIDALRGELVRLDGLREWDLKVSYDADTLSRQLGEYSEAVRNLDTEIAAATPGKRYLLERKRGELIRRELVRVARARAQSILDELRPLSSAVRTLPIPQTTEQLPVLLHAALLVHREKENDLVGYVERARNSVEHSGMSLSFSGPWAPYRFVQHEQTA
jgi:gas vesicle protein GvpL/GvpF